MLPGSTRLKTVVDSQNLHSSDNWATVAVKSCTLSNSTIDQNNCVSLCILYVLNSIMYWFVIDLYFFPVSEDTHSVDMTIRDNEDRGFYTETFHSAAWIYQGDDGDSGAIPPSLITRTRTISSKSEIL